MFTSPSSSLSSSSSSPLALASSISTLPSARPSSVHAASLVDPASHSLALLQLIAVELSHPVIEYVVDCVSETVEFALERPSPLPRVRSSYHTKFITVVSTTLSRAEVTVPTILTALVYVARARPHLSIAVEEWALERVFLGALITASKYTNDSTLKNGHWALCTGIFGKRDVGRIEREFLAVLDWELGVSEAELMAHHAGLSAASTVLSAPVPLVDPHPREHRRHMGVPELGPERASGGTSAASTSLRTPVHLSPTHPPSHKHEGVPMEVDFGLPQSRATQKSSKSWNSSRARPRPASRYMPEPRQRRSRPTMSGHSI